MHEKLKLQESTTEFILRDANGNIKPLWNANKLGAWMHRWLGIDLRASMFGSYGDSMLTHNLITNAGHAAANARMAGLGSYGTFVNIALGSGTTAAAVTDTALQTEITLNGGGRGAATASQVTTTAANDTLQLTKTFTFTGSLSITEEGILDNATAGGTLLAHQVFTAINVVNTDTLTITHRVQS